jgi:hypothetical protein
MNMSLASKMKVDILFNVEGLVCIFHSEPLPEILRWVEYDVDLETVTLVMDSGNIHDVGLKISPEHGKHMKTATEVSVVLVKDSQIHDLTVVPVVIRNTQE